MTKDSFKEISNYERDVYLLATISRYTFLLEKFTKYCVFMQNPILASNDDDILQFHSEYTVIRLTSLLEGLFKSMINTAVMHRSDYALKYLLKHKNESMIPNNMSPRDIYRWFSGQCSFDKKGKKLKRVFLFLFNFQLFPDKNTEDTFFDLIAVRNLIIHEGSWASEIHYKQIKTKGVIVCTDEEKKTNLSFYRLSFKNSFLVDAIKATQKIGIHITANIGGKKNGPSDMPAII